PFPYTTLFRSRRAGADEDRVVILVQQRLQAVDALAAAEVDSEIEDISAFLVDDGIRQAKLRNLGAHHAAGLRIAVEHHAFIAERRKVARNGERGGAAANQRDALAIFDARLFRHARGDVVLVVGGDALQPADRHRIILDPAAPASRFAGTIAGAS